MAGLPKVIASCPAGQAALSTAPSCYCPRRRVSNRQTGHFPQERQGLPPGYPRVSPRLAFDRSGVRNGGGLPRHRACRGQGSTPLTRRGDAAELDVLVAANRLGEARELQQAAVVRGRLPAQRPSDQSLVPRDQPPLLAPDGRVAERIVGGPAEPPERSERPERGPEPGSEPELPPKTERAQEGRMKMPGHAARRGEQPAGPCRERRLQMQTRHLVLEIGRAHV